MLYELFYARTPRKKKVDRQTFLKLVQTKRKRPSFNDEYIPEFISSLIHKCLEIDPSTRIDMVGVCNVLIAHRREFGDSTDDATTPTTYIPPPDYANTVVDLSDEEHEGRPEPDNTEPLLAYGDIHGYSGNV